MSEIDRIARQLARVIRGYHLLDPDDRLEPDQKDVDRIRAALLEYGEIVREECAQVADTYLDPADGAYSSLDTRIVGDAIARAIRNAHQD